MKADTSDLLHCQMRVKDDADVAPWRVQRSPCSVTTSLPTCSDMLLYSCNIRTTDTNEILLIV